MTAPAAGHVIRAATGKDVPLLLLLIRELGEYENLAHEVVASEEVLRHNLFGPRRHAEALIAETTTREDTVPRRPPQRLDSRHPGEAAWHRAFAQRCPGAADELP